MNYKEHLEAIYDKALGDELVSREEALFIINTPDEQLDTLLDYTNRLKLEKVGNEVLLCGIVNAKSGKCSEDCSFCAQSAHHKTKAEVYPLLSSKELLDASDKAKVNGVQCFSIVTSGKGVTSEQDFSVIKDTISSVEQLNRCASLGILSKAQFQELKKAGLNKYHHNLETAESFFANMCTTHSYEERVETIKAAKEAGLEVCCGGIFGIGESLEQRVELGLAIRELDVESVPINIVNPIEGTRIYSQIVPMRPQDILKLIATYRFLLPRKIIGVFGGREHNLKEWQPQIFPAGANAILLGNYLTTTGNAADVDLAMIKEAGLVPKYSH